MKYKMVLRIDEVNPVHTRLTLFDNGVNAGQLCLSKDGLVRLACQLSLPELLKDIKGLKTGWTVDLPDELVIEE